VTVSDGWSRHSIALVGQTAMMDIPRVRRTGGRQGRRRSNVLATGLHVASPLQSQTS
jgi:hypothetical protein